jgi:hypothetical protein
MSAESVAVAVSVVLASMGMLGGALRMVVHQLDFNRDSLARTARIHEDLATG